MYQNIGLPTPRGSGTSGYVTRNLSYVPKEKSSGRVGSLGLMRPKTGRADPEIAQHERLRQIEVTCLELEDKLQKEGMDDESILERIDALRKKLASETEDGLRDQESGSSMKEKNKRFAKALGLDEDEG
jgi:hypothetical protein